MNCFYTHRIYLESLFGSCLREMIFQRTIGHLFVLEINKSPSVLAMKEEECEIFLTMKKIGQKHLSRKTTLANERQIICVLILPK